MRLHRFFPGVPVAAGALAITNRELCHQWAKVLRLKTGDRVIVCDGEGVEAEAVIETLTENRALLRAETPRTVDAEPARSITLACAVLKRENFEWVVQKATEAGVSAIVPLITARTVKTGLKSERLVKIATEAAEQSGRGRIPDIGTPVALEAFLKRIVKPAVFFDCGGNDGDWPKAIVGASAASCIIGPEGGWTAEESALARTHGCIIGSLGKLTLRAETAATIAAYRTVHGC